MSKKQGTVQRYVLFFPYRDCSGGVYFRCDKQGKVYPDVMSVGIGGAAYRHCWQGRYNEYIVMPPVVVCLDEQRTTDAYAGADWGYSQTDIIRMPLTPEQARKAVERLASDVAYAMLQPKYDQGCALFHFMDWSDAEREQMRASIQKVLLDACVRKLSDPALAERSRQGRYFTELPNTPTDF